MHARELQLSIIVDAMPSGQLAERAWARACAQASTPQSWSIHKAFTAGAAEPIGMFNDCQLLATAAVSVNPNGATSAAPIQYP